MAVLVRSPVPQFIWRRAEITNKVDESGLPRKPSSRAQHSCLVGRGKRLRLGVFASVNSEVTKAPQLVERRLVRGPRNNLAEVTVLGNEVLYGLQESRASFDVEVTSAGDDELTGSFREASWELDASCL
jgi:hypothetical protein